MELIKKLVRKVPKKKKDIFAYKIDWDLIEKNKIIEKKIAPWVKKKWTDMIGNEEEGETLVMNVILEKLVDRSSAQEIYEIMEKIFAEEAEDFVKKLWRFIIFEVLKARFELV